MTCANFQELEAGLGAANQLTISPIDFPYDNVADLRLDIYNYEDQVWVNVPVGADGGANIDVGGAGVVHYEWEVFDNNGVQAVRTLSNADGATAGSHPLVPANNVFPVEGGAGRNVRLYRMTAIDAGDMPAIFYPGSAVKAEDLNDNFEALRKVVEEGACSTNNINDGIPQLDQRYWNKLDETLENGDTWVSDDAHIATTAAGDARWLNAVGGDIVGGPGIETTEASGSVTIGVELHDTTPGLELDGTGNAAQLRALGNSVIEDGTDVQLTNGPSNVTITGGNDISITRNSDTQLTIASTATGDTYDLNASDDGDNVDLNLTSGSGTDNSTVQLTAGSGITIEHTSNNEITFSTSSSTALWTNDNGTLEPSDNGRNVRVTDADGNQAILLNADGSGSLADGGIEFMIQPNTVDAGQLEINDADGNADIVLAGEGGSATFAAGEISFSAAGQGTFGGGVQAGDGSNLILENDAEDQTVSINADDCTASYTVTLPPTAPTADGQVLSVASGTDDVELEWADGGGGASVSVGENPPEAASDDNEGNLWFNSDTGRLFISFTDEGDDSQWIDAAPAADAGTPTLQQVCDEGNQTTTEIEIRRDANGLANAIEFRNNTNATGTATGIGMEFWLNNSNPQDTGARINCMENGIDDHAGIQIETTGPNSANPPVFTEKFRIQPNGQMVVTGFDASSTITSAANAGQIRIHDPSDYNGLPQFVLGSDDSLADTETIRYVVVDDLVDQTKSRSASLGVRRNTTIKAGFVNLVTDDNSNGFLWVSNSDIVRTSNGANNVGSTSGGVAVGDQTSDIRVKKNITDYTDGLNKIEQLNPVNFVYTHDDSETVHAGFIAQQVQSIIPESVYDTNEKLPLRDETGEVIRQVPVDEEGVAVANAEPEVQYEDGPNKLAMSYVEIIPALVNAVKELSAEVKALKEAQ